MKKIIKHAVDVVSESGSLAEYSRATAKYGNGTVGFVVDGKLRFEEELPDTPIKDLDESRVTGIFASHSAGSSDVEVDTGIISEEDFDPADFEELREEKEKEANYYYERDSSTWYMIFRDSDRKCAQAFAHMGEWNDELTWDDEGDLTDEEKQEIQEAISGNMDEISRRSDIMKYCWHYGKEIDESKTFRAGSLLILEHLNDGLY